MDFKYINMRYLLLLFTASLTFFSCRTQEIKNTHIDKSALTAEKLISAKGYEMRMRGIDFFASGKEPFWSIAIDFEQNVYFKSEGLDKDVIISIRKLIQDVEKPESNYQIKGEGINLRIHIKPNANPFIYDETNKPYTVQIEAKRNKDTDWQIYQGQGEYFGKLTLHDIWGLTELNGKSVSDYQIIEEPYVEIHLDNNRMSGFLGCNVFGGPCYFGRGKIVTGPLMSTKKACLNSNIEADFAQALSNKSFLYKVDNGILTLWNDQSKLIFKKRD